MRELSECMNFEAVRRDVVPVMVGQHYVDGNPDEVFAVCNQEAGIYKRFVIDGEMFGLRNGKIKVTKGMMAAWNESENVQMADLIRAAEQNSIIRDDCLISPMQDMIGFTVNEPGDSGLYVITNRAKTYGAAAIMLPGVEAELDEIFPDGHVILPSSVHEVLAVRKPDNLEDIERLSEMVRQINEMVVEPDEVLANEALVLRNGKMLSAEKEFARQMEAPQKRRSTGRTM